MENRLYFSCGRSMKYIFLDIDGTLFSSRINGVPESALKAVRIAREKGSRIFLCTGRSLAECADYFRFDTNGFLFGAGAMIYADGKRIYDHPFESSEVQKIKDLIRSCGFCWMAEGAAGAYYDEDSKYYIAKYYAGHEVTDPDEARYLCVKHNVYPEMYEDADEKIYKFCAYAPYDSDYSRLRNSLPDQCALNFSYHSPEMFDCAEITDKTINKATGIQRVLEYFHADRSEAVGIGDSENDIPMMHACGIGIAMGNAMPSVKEQADWVTTDILDDGIWNAFEHIGIL